ncbi:MAG: primosomal protein N' [Gammaproteobacteria bacterium]|nr:primosomal protein N' [Gammaproteobacteria bacterium]
MNSGLVQVAVPTPLYQVFDYRWGSIEPICIGGRVQVPFGRRKVVGIVVGEITHTDVPTNKLRRVQEVLDTEPALPPDLMNLLTWASRYYHHPIGEVLSTALPVLLRKGKPAALQAINWYSLDHEKLASEPALVPSEKRAAVQHTLFRFLQEATEPVAESALRALSPRFRAALKPLIDKQLVQMTESAAIPRNTATESAPTLLEEQLRAVAAVNEAQGKFAPFLLNGVTGSGKTEVYLQCLQTVLEKNQQVLILVPEISLTPQLMRRFERRVTGCLVSLHSGLNDTERLQNWMLAAKGHADVVIGTRSAVLAPMPRLGLVVVDEEHDASLKQQDGFRYHARDLALLRARDRQCPIVLGTATASFESLHNVARNRFTELVLSIRAGDAQPPELALLDIRRRPLIEGMSDRLIMAIKETIENDGQALVFINRRGFAPTLLCNDCGASSTCLRCDAHMTVHAARKRLRCHHCGAERALPDACDECGSDQLDCVGYGTQRIAQALEAECPGVTVARIDRDSTRRKGAMAEQLDAATRGDAQILVGTQMLAKGHHFPNVTLVGILDADRGLFGTDFRALEQMGQLVLQVAGRAGREAKRGRVLIQTRNPDNPMLRTLVTDGYATFASVALQDREQAQLPPYAFVALVRAESPNPTAATEFLTASAQLLNLRPSESLFVMGPAPAPMERLGGKYRAQLLLQAAKRSELNNALSLLTQSIEQIPAARRARWSIDVDPVDLF